ncbi:MAG: hypothetical protein KUG77_16900, partial [Nannocystaceae bacterium]|nr:hypothetical protein [Nannocystaceae bacterium]
MSRNDRETESRPNPMNNLVPYLDLFCRLEDGELARLGGVELDVVVSLRAQVDTINEGLAAYADLLPRLGDSELVRLTGASDRTVRFWRLCQPRHALPAKPAAAPPAEPAAASEPAVPASRPPDSSERSPTAPHSPVAASSPDNTGRFPSAAAMGEEGPGAGYVCLLYTS